MCTIHLKYTLKAYNSISFGIWQIPSVCVCVCVCVRACACACVLNCVQLFMIPWTVFLQAALHGIFQARILEWAAISYSRRSSWPRDQIHISCIGRWILNHCTTWEAHIPVKATQFKKWLFPLPPNIPHVTSQFILPSTLSLGMCVPILVLL